MSLRAYSFRDAWKPRHSRVGTFCASMVLALLAACGGDRFNSAYAVGGSISGLNAQGLVLANGSDAVSITADSTTFAFAGRAASGSGYSVTVASQPAGQSCSIAGGNGTVGAGDVTTVQVNCVSTFSVGGAVIGLAGAGLVLASGSDSLSIVASATGFALPTRLVSGASYAISVQTQPIGQTCSINNAAGTVASANIVNVTVTCAAAAHLLGGSISGLASTGLVLTSGGDALRPAAGATTFVFASSIAQGGTYSVAVQTQPTGETCSVGGGSGIIGTSDVLSVQVTCSANAYNLFGAVVGLAGPGLILANGADRVSVSPGSPSFAFSKPVAYGGTYDITVAQQPVGETCSVIGTYPISIGAGDVNDIAVSCAAASEFTLIAGNETCPAGNLEVDGTGTSAVLRSRVAGTFDAAGNLYEVSSGSTVRKVTPGGVVSTLAGSQFNPGSADGTGSAASFLGLGAIASDATGNLYVVDNNKIRKITQSGVVTTIAGLGGGSGYRNGTGSAAFFGNPEGMAVDSAGNIFVSDKDNNAIRMVTPAGVVTTFAGGGSPLSPSSGLSGFADGVGIAARFRSPEGIAFDPSGNLFVADGLNNAIRMITPAGVVTTVAGTAAAGVIDGAGSAARFSEPFSLFVDASGNVYVNDADGFAIRMVTPAGLVTTVAVTNNFVLETGFPQPSSAVVFSGISSNFVFVVNGAGVIYINVGCALEKVGP